MENPYPVFLAPRQPEQNYYLLPHNYWGTRSRPVAPKMCCWTDCSSYAGWQGTPLCEKHANDVWARVDESQPEAFKQLQREQRTAFLRQAEARKEKERAANAVKSFDRSTEPGYIYYLRIGDLIKIGYTFFLEDRMKAYPPNAELLATHPGTRQTERQMHHKFLHQLKRGREWFAPADDLMEHIKDVCEKFPQDDEGRAGLRLVS